MAVLFLGGLCYGVCVLAVRLWSVSCAFLCLCVLTSVFPVGFAVAVCFGLLAVVCVSAVSAWSVRCCFLFPIGNIRLCRDELA